MLGIGLKGMGVLGGRSDSTLSTHILLPAEPLPTFQPGCSTCIMLLQDLTLPFTSPVSSASVLTPPALSLSHTHTFLDVHMCYKEQQEHSYRQTLRLPTATLSNQRVQSTIDFKCCLWATLFLVLWLDMCSEPSVHLSGDYIFSTLYERKININVCQNCTMFGPAERKKTW